MDFVCCLVSNVAGLAGAFSDSECACVPECSRISVGCRMLRVQGMCHVHLSSSPSHRNLHASLYCCCIHSLHYANSEKGDMCCQTSWYWKIAQKIYFLRCDIRMRFSLRFHSYRTSAWLFLSIILATPALNENGMRLWSSKLSTRYASQRCR